MENIDSELTLGKDQCELSMQIKNEEKELEQSLRSLKWSQAVIGKLSGIQKDHIQNNIDFQSREVEQAKARLKVLRACKEGEKND